MKEDRPRPGSRILAIWSPFSWISALPDSVKWEALAIKVQRSIATLPLPRSPWTGTQGKSGITIVQSHESFVDTAKGGGDGPGGENLS